MSLLLLSLGMMRPVSCFLVLMIALLATTQATNPVKEFYITCPQDSFNYIYDNYTVEHYITVTFVYNDKMWPNVKLRIRGDSSRKYPKKSLKLKFEQQPFENGRDVINLNADYFDKSYVHAFLTSCLFQAAGHPCATIEHVRVYVNDTYLGLYMLLENVDAAFLESWQLDSDGNLYKAARDNSCLSIYDDVYSVWEKKTNEEESWDDLFNLIYQMNAVADNDYFAFSNAQFDYEKMINILAINMLTANGSTYYHNYYMYHDIKGSDQWLMIPWDLDKTFAAYGSGYPYDRSSTAYNHDNPFLERALINPEIFNAIRLRIDQLAEHFFNSTFFDPLIDSLQSILAPSVQADATDDLADTSNWILLLQEEKNFIRDRVSKLNQQFASYPRPFQALPTPEVFTGDIVFRWHPSFDPDGDPLTYVLKYSTDLLFKSDATITFGNITDTVFTLPENPAPDSYYWIVYATDGSNYMTAYDSKNTFTYKIPAQLPETINETLRLTKDKSPYLARSDITVTPAGKLEVDSGVEIHFKPGSSLYVNGIADFNGTAAEPIRLIPALNEERWGALCIENAAGPVVLNHMYIEYAGRGSDSIKWKAAVTVYFSKVRIHNVTIDRVIQPIYTYGSDVEVSDCCLAAGTEGDILNLRHGKATVQNCYLYGLSAGDGIDYDHIMNGRIEHNTILDSRDDGIDIGETSQNVLIQYNWIGQCNDKAISVGEQSTANIYRNRIVNNHWGIAVKDSSYALIDHNTFYSNDIALLCYEKIATAGPGHALAANNIFSRSHSQVYRLDALSILDICYSLSDTDTLDGTGNLHADPAFIDTAARDFRLQPFSPCINRGDPQAPMDPDGTCSDIGAFHFNLNALDLVIFNEINYDSSPEYNTGDWLELFNPQDTALDLSGWSLKDKDTDHIFIIGESISLPSKGYRVICRDTSRFREATGLAIPIIGNFNFGLARNGEVIKLYESSGALVDSVKYDTKIPWPSASGGIGKTLELIDVAADNNHYENWKFSLFAGGTPGEVNSVAQTSQSSEDVLKSFRLTQNYPNPFNGSTAISYTISEPGKVELIVYDLLGRMIDRYGQKHTTNGTFNYQWQANSCSSGIYFITAKWNDKLTAVKKALLIK